MTAPDYAEPPEAWRVWSVVRHDGRLRLRSIVYDIVWPPGEPLVAECFRHVETPFDRLLGRTRHAAPSARCQCGIYGATLTRLDPYLREAPGADSVARVFGVVALWGTAVECERGWRASHAYPLRLFVPRSSIRTGEPPADEIAVRLSDYGVPVEATPSVDGRAAG